MKIIIIIFDVGSQNVFDTVSQYVNELKSFEKDKFILIGYDYENKPRTVTYQQGKDFAETINSNYYEISPLNTDIFEEQFLSLFSDLQPEEQIDEIYVYHLTRRLNGSIEDKSSDNLKSLLLKESAISTFLRQYGIAFIEKDSHTVIVFNDREISLEDTFESDVCYLRSRLGYNSGREDYCFNGFALRDQLMRNSYTRQLYGGPEFLDVLSRYLSIDGLKEKYCENSK